jgi:hypothetical protein
MDLVAAKGAGDASGGVEAVLGFWGAVDGEEYMVEMEAAVLGRNETHHAAGHEESHNAGMSGDGFGDGSVDPAGQAATLMRGEHDKIGFVVGEVFEDRSDRIVAGTFDLVDVEPEVADGLFGTARGNQTPAFEGLADAGEVVPVDFLGVWIRVEDVEVGLGAQGELDGVQEGAFVTRAEV